MPRRIPDYPDAYADWNFLSSIGSMVSVVAVILFGYIIYDIFANGHPVTNNPWGIPSYFTSLHVGPNSIDDEHEYTTTLEWSLDSPTPHHAYNMLPVQS